MNKSDSSVPQSCYHISGTYDSSEPYIAIHQVQREAEKNRRFYEIESRNHKTSIIEWEKTERQLQVAVELLRDFSRIFDVRMTASYSDIVARLDSSGLLEGKR